MHLIKKVETGRIRPPLILRRCQERFLCLCLLVDCLPSADVVHVLKHSCADMQSLLHHSEDCFTDYCVLHIPENCLDSNKI